MLVLYSTPVVVIDRFVRKKVNRVLLIYVRAIVYNLIFVSLAKPHFTN